MKWSVQNRKYKKEKAWLRQRRGERRKEKGERIKDKGERRKKKGERRKEKGERRKEKGGSRYSRTKECMKWVLGTRGWKYCGSVIDRDKLEEKTLSIAEDHENRVPLRYCSRRRSSAEETRRLAKQNYDELIWPLLGLLELLGLLGLLRLMELLAIAIGAIGVGAIRVMNIMWKMIRNSASEVASASVRCSSMTEATHKQL